MPQVPAGATVPPELARQLVDAAVLGLAVQAGRNGGGQPPPGMRDLLARIDAAASRRACAPPVATVGPRELTTADAARVMRVSPQQVRKLAAAHKIIARKVGRDWLIDAQAAEDYRRNANP